MYGQMLNNHIISFKITQLKVKLPLRKCKSNHKLQLPAGNNTYSIKLDATTNILSFTVRI